MFDQLPDLRFKLQVIIPKYSRIAESTYIWVIPLMMQFLVLKCVSTYTRVYTVNTSFIFSKCSSLNVGVVWLRKGLLLLVITLMTRSCIFSSGSRAVANATPCVVIQY